MGSRQSITVAVVLLSASWAFSADDPKTDDYARVEVRAMLQKFRPNTVRMPEIEWYCLLIGKGSDGQHFRLELPSEYLRKQAKELNRQAVVVLGDLIASKDADRVKGDPNQWTVIRVKSIRKVELPKK